jgi:hypothetical protein
VLAALGRTGDESVLTRFLVGGIILAVLALIPVLGALVMAVATVFGLGALLLGIRAWIQSAAAMP